MDRLVPVWNGAMEAAGLAPGLSGAIGPSTLTCRDFVYVEDPQAVDVTERERRPVARILWDRARDGEAVALLRRGVSLSGAARSLRTTKGCIRNVAKRHGLCR